MGARSWGSVRFLSRLKVFAARGFEVTHRYTRPAPMRAGARKVSSAHLLLGLLVVRRSLGDVEHAGGRGSDLSLGHGG